MSKWRPNSKSECVYVIADIHGAHNLLDKILKRILPLRKSEGIHDKIIFLGDYIDRHIDSHKVIDELIALKEQYKNNVVFLMGNHELMMLQSLELIPMNGNSVESIYKTWIHNGGYQTITGYINRLNLNIDPLSISKDRIRDLIPKSHLDFLLSLKATYTMDNYIFVHGGIDVSNLEQLPPQMSVWTEKTTEYFEPLVWDRGLCKHVIAAIKNGTEVSWDQTIITGYNVWATASILKTPGVPIIHNKFMMLDCGSPKRLLVIELNSMEAFMAYPDKDRLIKFDLTETS